MKKILTLAVAAACMLATQAKAVQPVVFPLYSNNFNGATLGNSVNEREGFPIVTVVATPDPNTSDPEPGVLASAPAGWSVDNNFGDGSTGVVVPTDLAYDGISLGDPNVVDLDEGFAPTVGTIYGNTGWPNVGEVEHGVDEWEGWSFVQKDFWVEAAGDQDRSLFTGGSGGIAVVDPDEYDDLGDGRGGFYMNSGLTLPNFNFAIGDLIQLTYDYSFRAEAFDDGHDPNGGSVVGGRDLNNSTASTYITYRDGVGNALGTDVLSGSVLDSDAGFNDPNDPLNPANRPASATLATAGDIDGSFTGFIPTGGGQVPAGAVSFDITFGLINAGNDWWYAIDNVGVNGTGGQSLNEDFDSLAFGDSINEQRSAVPDKVTALNNDPGTSPRLSSYSPTAPGWTVDNSALPTIATDPNGVGGDNNVGVLEFEGWNFMDLDFWTFADGQQREQFVNSDGVFAVADGDEWDDLGDPTNTDPNDGPVGGLMDTKMTSNAFSVAGADPNTLVLSFDSSWRDEDDNTAIITAIYDGDPNTAVEILRFESNNNNGFFKDDAPNETVVVSMQMPAGASTAELEFRYIGGNDWWWAVDNIQVGTIPEPATLGMSLLGALGFGMIRRRK